MLDALEGEDLTLPVNLISRLVRLVGVGWLVGLLGGWLVGRSVGWVVGWLISLCGRSAHPSVQRSLCSAVITSVPAVCCTPALLGC